RGERSTHIFQAARPPNRDTCWSWHLPRTEVRGGCRGFIGPVPPPLLMWCCLWTREYSNGLNPHLHAQFGRSPASGRGAWRKVAGTMDLEAMSTPEDAEPPSPETAKDPRRRARRASSA